MKSDRFKAAPVAFGAGGVGTPLDKTDFLIGAVLRAAGAGAAGMEPVGFCCGVRARGAAALL